ncbi:MAG: response regulator transcription factor [Sphingobacteriales bacterium]|nr:MAG: response regulator transcription factor [Sphingobacteriales bacterium]
MKETYTCILIDDEPNAIGLLDASLKELFSEIEVKATCTDWASAMKTLRSTPFDIVFLDISMPGKNGIDLLKLMPTLESEVIFVTAHHEYAIEAFKLSACGYILKPIEDAELVQAVNKAIEHVNNKRLAQQLKNGAAAASPSIIGIPNNKGVDYVKAEDIFYFEAVNKCTKVVSRHAEILSSYNIGRFKEAVEGLGFFQVHRSFIVNMHHIRRYVSSGDIVMDNSKEIPVSRYAKDEFLKQFSIVSNVRINIDDMKR